MMALLLFLKENWLVCKKLSLDGQTSADCSVVTWERRSFSDLREKSTAEISWHDMTSRSAWWSEQILHKVNDMPPTFSKQNLRKSLTCENLFEIHFFLCKLWDNFKNLYKLRRSEKSRNCFDFFLLAAWPTVKTFGFGAALFFFVSIQKRGAKNLN